jgi:hypothetical protein
MEKSCKKPGHLKAFDPHAGALAAARNRLRIHVVE